MTARRPAVLAAAAVLVAALTACTPAAGPTPSPTPTGFASEEQAFAAAEETYRAYIDALNHVDLADPATFEPVYALLSDRALDGSKKELTELHAEALEKVGPTKVASIRRNAADLSNSSVSLNVCLDVSEVDIRNSSGDSVVPADRNDFQLLAVDFAPEPPGSAALSIARSTAVSDEPCG